MKYAMFKLSIPADMKIIGFTDNVAVVKYLEEVKKMANQAVVTSQR